MSFFGRNSSSANDTTSSQPHTHSSAYAYRELDTGNTRPGHPRSVMYTRDWRSALRTPPTYRIGNRTLRFNYHFALMLVCVFSLFLLFFYVRAGSQSSSEVAWLKNYGSSTSAHSMPVSRMPQQRLQGGTTTYNAKYPLTPPIVGHTGDVTYRIAIVADLDTNSKLVKPDGSTLWRSYLKKGYLTHRLGKNELSVKWDAGEPKVLESGFALKGRGMELSELVTFNGKLLSFDDRTGLIYELHNDKPIPWVILLDGDGHNAKGFKAEWATVKDQQLYVGSMGKEWTTGAGDFENENPMFVKVVSPNGEVRSYNWAYNFKLLRQQSLQISWPGYMIHESGTWSEVHKKWFFLPRRCSNDKYNETRDEHMGCNVLITADERFSNVQTVKLDASNTAATHGFSSFKFVPGTDDRVIVAIKSEELDGKTSTFITAFDIQGSQSSSDVAWLKNNGSSTSADSMSVSGMPQQRLQGGTTNYNATYPLTPPIVGHTGDVTYRIAIVADLDTNSKLVKPDGSTLWRSYLKKGYLTHRLGKNELSVKWDAGEPKVLESGFALKGRGMELSELVTFNGKLLSFDDRTGLIYELHNDTPIPWVILLDGDGHNAKGFKAEWATVKDQQLYVGSMGKEWTTGAGDVENENPMFVKVVPPNGEVRAYNWADNFKLLRQQSLQISWPGYVIHESGIWSEVHKKWFFLPRRCSNDKYNETRDEHMGCNVLITADERFSNVQTVKLDASNTAATHGFSSFKFVPGTDDRVIVAIKSEELDGKTSTFITAFDIEGSQSSSDVAWLKNNGSSTSADSMSVSGMPQQRLQGGTTNYNATYPLTPPIVGHTGDVTYRIAIVADLDTNSKLVKPDGSTLWRSYLKKGYLTHRLGKNELSVKWDAGEPKVLESGFALKGRGMELSELVTFNGKLLSFDDRTGLIYELHNDTPIPWVILLDGDGHNAKGFKAEWATVKDQQLYVGSMGKEWTTGAGDVENENPMFVKVVPPNGEVRAYNWADNFKLLRQQSLQISWPGYVIHESGIWSEVHKKWFFLPRRCSNDKYNETRDEHMGCNVLITADERFSNVQTVKLDASNTAATHGFSSFKFVPGTDDRVIVAIKSEELDGKTSTFITAFDIEGKTLLPEQKIDTEYKYEGIEFI